VFINLDNVLTLEREGDLTTVVMIGGEKVYIDTMSETLIRTVPSGSRRLRLVMLRQERPSGSSSFLLVSVRSSRREGGA
jgi:hypothetical protein